MKEDDESASRSSNGAGKGKKKKNPGSHNHIGPNVRAFRAGRAFCPVCDAEKSLRLTERERDIEKVFDRERDFTRTRKASH